MEDSQAKTAEEVLKDFKRQPFNFGIKELKRVLSRMDMPKSEKNRTIRLYKERLYTRVKETRAKMEKELKLPEGENVKVLKPEEMPTMNHEVKDATDK